MRTSWTVAPLSVVLLLCATRTDVSQDSCDLLLNRTDAAMRFAIRDAADRGIQRAVLVAVQADSASVDSEIPNGALDSLHRADSAQVGWAIVMLAADEVRTSESEAWYLMQQYRLLDGAMAPLLDGGLTGRVSPKRWSTLLTGARQPVDATYRKHLECLERSFETMSELLAAEPGQDLWWRWRDGLDAALRSIQQLLSGRRAYG